MQHQELARDGIIAELTCRVVVIAVVLTVLLALSNAYLALKLGILTSASIPAAILSMGILQFFKNSTILENNAVQTAASAGEAVAGGIVYTIPALIIIGYWFHFDYVTNFLIAACGGILGVLFSIPLRKILVHDNSLRFPEGRAIAEVLQSQSSAKNVRVRELVLGGIVGALLELLQVGFKVLSSQVTYWFAIQRSLFGFGMGFSATMIGAGYLIGYEIAVSLLLGAVISWLIALPIASQFYPEFIQQHSTADAAILLWNSEMRYFGIGAMLCAGVWTFIKLIRPLLRNMRHALRFVGAQQAPIQVSRVEQDLPITFIGISILLMAIVLFLFFQHLFPLAQLGFAEGEITVILLVAVAYVLIVGCLFSVITAYFSGMVGVTASPGSSVVIAGILFAAWLLLWMMNTHLVSPFTHSQLQIAEAITIIIGSIVTGSAAIANDNTQDLKVGHLVGATPWKQQVMLLLGVIVAALVIPPVMQLLFNVYGIAGVMPRSGMDVALSLPAPTAALLAAVTQAVFQHQMPWLMMLMGVVVTSIILLLNYVLNLQKFMRLSILGVAMGMYLPITSTVPLFVGGLVAWFIDKRLHKKFSINVMMQRKQIGTLIACGLVAGSALMDVVLAIPFSIFHSPDALCLVGMHWNNTYGVMLSIVSTVLLASWLYHWCSRRAVGM